MPTPQHSKKSSDPIYELTLRLRILPQLLKDSRVHVWLKILPFIGLIFIFFPSLIISIPVTVFFVIIGFYLFFQLSPQAVVEEYLEKLRQTLPGEWKDKK